jgi:Icc-related predicted phosphoesterase
MSNKVINKQTNFLIMSDIHEQYQNFNLAEIENKYINVKIDAILIAGDITNRGLISDTIKRLLWEWFYSLGFVFDCPIYFIPGNHDIDMRTWQFKDTAFPQRNIYNQQTSLNEASNISLIGMSLSPCYDMPSLKHAWDNMVCHKPTESRYYKRFESLSIFSDYQIFISHCPPNGYLDECAWKNQDGKEQKANIGSLGLLNLIKKVQPKIVICGHVHEQGGKMEVIKHLDTKKTTTIINVATTYKLLSIAEDGCISLR